MLEKKLADLKARERAGAGGNRGSREAALADRSKDEAAAKAL